MTDRKQPDLKSFNSDDSQKEYSGGHKEYASGPAQANLVQNDIAK